MLQLLDSDPRPTLVLDAHVADLAKPVYWNSALVAIDYKMLLNALVGEDYENASGDTARAYSLFRKWMLNSHASTGVSSVHCGHTWTTVLVDNRWTVISGMSTSVAENRRGSAHSPEAGKALLRVPSGSKVASFDWTVDPPPAKISSHVAWARSIDWANTPLGPMSSWSSQLRSTANLAMQDPRPAVIFWGPDLIMIYNEAYIDLLGGFHPCMGDSARIALSDVWPKYFEPIIEQNLLGETVEKTNTSVHMVRNGFMEETYFSLKFIPIFDAGGATVGHYEPLVETTREVISERRARTLLQLSEEVPRARNSDSYWALATEVLSRNDKDIPFALLYSVEADPGSDASSNMTRFSDNHQEGVLRGSFGLPIECPAAPAHLDFQQDHGFTPYFKQAMLARNPITVQFDAGSPAAELMRGVHWKGYGDACRAAVVCPMNPTSSKDNILGYIVIGLNPRRPYDDDYRQFIMLATRLLSTSLSSILLHEEDIHRRERTIQHAESMRLELKQQLDVSQKKLEREVLKFQRFAERADIGIFIVDMAGVFSYRNDAWYHILRPESREIELDEAWETLIDDEYVELGQARFKALIETKEHQYIGHPPLTT
jgi:PAS domain-containing protein